MVSTEQRKRNNLVVEISRITSQTSNFFLVYSWNRTNLTGNQCFNELNSSEAYQICIQPVLASERVVPGTCRFIITSTRNVRLTTRTGSCFIKNSIATKIGYFDYLVIVQVNLEMKLAQKWVKVQNLKKSCLLPLKLTD